MEPPPTNAESTLVSLSAVRDRLAECLRDLDTLNLADAACHLQMAIDRLPDQ